jgi:hypothetical protein
MISVVNTNKHLFYNLQPREQIRCPQRNTNTHSETSPTKKKETFSTKECELKQNFFDPTKQSPPNDFMQKLHKRMDIYN